MCIQDLQKKYTDVQIIFVGVVTFTHCVNILFKYVSKPMLTHKELCGYLSIDSKQELSCENSQLIFYFSSIYLF